jgi:hypothetical protein
VAKHDNESSIGGDSEKSENISFRVPKRNLDQLRQLANENQTSLNVLANQIFASYLDWTHNTPKADMVPVTKVLFIDLLEGIRKNT